MVFRYPRREADEVSAIDNSHDWDWFWTFIHWFC